MKKKFLVVIDESEELEKAIYFAAKRAIHTDGKLSLLYIVDPAINAQWSRIENLISKKLLARPKNYAEYGHKKLNLDLILKVRSLLKWEIVAKSF